MVNNEHERTHKMVRSVAFLYSEELCENNGNLLERQVNVYRSHRVFPNSKANCVGFFFSTKRNQPNLTGEL